MRFYEFKPLLTEARGLASRKIGDTFSSEGNEDLTFAGINFFPESGKFESEEEMQAAIDSAEKKYKEITWLNGAPKTGGFGVVTFTTPEGKHKHFGRYFTVIKAAHASMSWSNTDIPGYRLSTGSGAKETAGMQPSEVLTRFDNLSPKDIVKQIADKFGAKSPFTQVAKMVATGRGFPLSIPKQDGLSFEAFRDYFCEMLHPIALMNHTTSGNADEAEALFLPGSSYSDCAISFSTSKTEGLSDSILVNPTGQNIKVSSKGKGGGAAASVKNLLEAVKELKNPKLQKKHKGTLDLINIIVKSGMNESPSELAMHFNVINEKEAALVTRLKTLANKGVTYKQVLNSDKYLTKRLKKIYSSREPRNAEAANPHAHMVTCLAYMMSDKINNEGGFSKAASEILNNAGLVTVDTKAKETATEWIIEDFAAKFPGESITGVLLSAQKGYSSTTLKGNFTFVILKNNANPASFKDPAVEPAPDVKKKAAPKKKVTARSGGAEGPKKKTGTRKKR